MNTYSLNFCLADGVCRSVWEVANALKHIDGAKPNGVIMAAINRGWNKDKMIRQCIAGDNAPFP